MPVVEFKRDLLFKARDRAILNAEERGKVEALLKQVDPSIHTFDVRLEEYPDGYWKSMLNDTRLTPNQRAVVARYVFGMSQRSLDSESLYASEVSTPVEFGSTVAMLGNKSPNCEFLLNGRWYPVIVNCQFTEDESKVARDVNLLVNLSICEITITRYFAVFRDYFLDQHGHSVSRTVLEVLSMFGLRSLQTGAAEYNLRLVKAERQARETGRVVLVAGQVLMSAVRSWFSTVESRSLGSAQFPRKAVVEPELEVEENHRHYFGRGGTQGEGLSRLPFVRLFCMEIKGYIYADVDDLSPYEFDTESLGRLCLPPKMLSVLSRVFETPVDRIFGDLIRGKHGGIVVLASGKPGVGKTLTAEIYAEKTERPLYVLEMGELGTSATEVEQHLRTVFARVMRWNAVLQFDECEIFLAKRNQDLERSAIVGIFLRLLDYYEGMLFLTSNRPEIIDEAVLSRVMLHLRYPDLTIEARAEIWRQMFSAAGLKLNDDRYEELARHDLNGRQIRNLTRLAKMLHADDAITMESMSETLQLGGAGIVCGDANPD
jgi:hypothetical protein